MWFRVVREVSETHVFKDIEQKEGGGEVAIVSDARDTPIHATTQWGLNYLLDDVYEVDNYRLPAPKNKTIPIGDNDRQQGVDEMHQNFMG